jgi:hypothetical protein
LAADYGVGYGEARYSVYGASASDDGVMWQARVGLTYPINPTTSADFGFRYLDTPQFRLSGGGAALKAHTGLEILSVGAIASERSRRTT